MKKGIGNFAKSIFDSYVKAQVIYDTKRLQ